MVHQFSQAPTADIPRSRFNLSHGYKTTFNSDMLVPFFSMEALPGDTISVDPTMFARMNTPLYPIMDNLHLDWQFFAVPIRQIWTNFRKFMGEQVDPADSIDYTVPISTAPATTGYSNESLQDYLGLPTKVPDYEHSALFTRAYNHIYNEWYRDQNLVDSATVDTGDGPDNVGNYGLKRRGKRHDYFTSALPWLQKPDATYSAGVTLPLGTEAPVTGIGNTSLTYPTADQTIYETGQTSTVTFDSSFNPATSTKLWIEEDPNNAGYPNIRADLSNATAATINQLRQAFQIQKLLERDARSGTRYAEIVKAHFGVNFLDVTYRPEYLGGGSSMINVNQVAQTSNDGTNGSVGDLAAFATATAQGGGFTKSFTEHCIIMGIMSVRADLTYQQGLDRKFTRSTRYDFYWPSLSHIGEQSIPTIELYCQNPTTDTGSTGTPDNEKIFGYQERYAEYRYMPSKITGKLRSNDAATLDAWHLSQEFTSLPTLDETFIQENCPMDRVVATTTEPDFVFDSYIDCQCARPMPLFAVPGMIDHF